MMTVTRAKERQTAAIKRARNRVFDMTELFENILLHLPIKHVIINATRVSRHGRISSTTQPGFNMLSSSVPYQALQSVSTTPTTASSKGRPIEKSWF
ncbi:hypothetical protein AC579_7705 [Pseudocercospora musae]|uniref:Uncharacterized protein n=1 Tax=Pseudocercospora musae TaxID=113226 RepID=A0A139ITR9_9PEZI|nr:hypothetical protein AC579_7705 [Pseudocercospora musae]